MSIKYDINFSTIYMLINKYSKLHDVENNSIKNKNLLTDISFS